MNLYRNQIVSMICRERILFYASLIRCIDVIIQMYHFFHVTTLVKNFYRGSEEDTGVLYFCNEDLYRKICYRIVLLLYAPDHKGRFEDPPVDIHSPRF